MQRRSRSLRLVLAVGGLIAVTAACGESGEGGGGEPSAARGQELYSYNCASCHGPALDGTATGPPLVHVVYEPSHHGDDAFRRAVAQGVQPHHWEFGPMPPVPGVEASDVEDIIAYVRREQRAAGIE